MFAPGPGTPAARRCTWLVVFALCLRLLLPGLHTHDAAMPSLSSMPSSMRSSPCSADALAGSRSNDHELARHDAGDDHRHGCLACDLDDVTPITPPPPPVAEPPQRLGSAPRVKAAPRPLVLRYRAHPSRAPPTRTQFDVVLTPA